MEVFYERVQMIFTLMLILLYYCTDLPARTGIPAEVGSILEKPIADKGMFLILKIR